MLGEPTGPPEEFVAFVARRSGEVDPAGPAFTGIDPLSAAQRREVFAAVALRWWWLRLQETRFDRRHAPDVFLDQLVRRQVTRWAPTTATLTVGPARSPSLLDRPLAPTDLAEIVWADARRVRRRRAFTTAVVTVVALLLLAAPRPGGSGPEPAPPTDPSTARPALTDVLPRSASLLLLPGMDIPALPPRLDLSTDGVIGALSGNPVDRAVALFQPIGEPAIYLLGGDGRLRTFDVALPPGSRLTSTSLSRDGSRAALLLDTGVAVVEIVSRSVHVYQFLDAQAPASFVWLDGSVLDVSGPDGTASLNVVTGAVGAVRYGQGDLLQAQIPGVPVELISAGDPATTPVRLRRWLGGAPVDTPVTVDASATGTGWLRQWLAPGWQEGSTLARDASAAGLTLPGGDGLATSATVVVDEDTGRVRRVLANTGPLDPPAVLGFVDPTTVLVWAGDANGFGILAWTWDTGEFRLVSQLTRVAVGSLALT